MKKINSRKFAAIIMMIVVAISGLMCTLTICLWCNNWYQLGTVYLIGILVTSTITTHCYPD